MVDDEDDEAAKNANVFSPSKFFAIINMVYIFPAHNFIYTHI